MASIRALFLQIAFYRKKKTITDFICRIFLNILYFWERHEIYCAIIVNVPLEFLKTFENE